MSKEQDQVFFRNYSIVIGILAVMIVVFLIAARAIGIKEETDIKQRAAQTAENTAPVGQIRVAGEEQPMQETQVATMEPATDSGETAADTGKQVYSGLCFSCHGTGLPGIPQFGDKEAWSARIAQGNDMLHQNAINGFTGSSGIMMPPKGGNPALSDEEVKAAVDYMVSNSQ